MYYLMQLYILSCSSLSLYFIGFTSLLNFFTYSLSDSIYLFKFCSFQLNLSTTCSSISIDCFSIKPSSFFPLPSISIISSYFSYFDLRTLAEFKYYYFSFFYCSPNRFRNSYSFTLLNFSILASFSLYKRSNNSFLFRQN